MEEGWGGRRCLPCGDQDVNWGPAPHLALGQAAWRTGAGRLSLGGIWDTGWILEPPWGPEKFNFLSPSCPGIFPCHSLPLTVPALWFWPV